MTTNGPVSVTTYKWYGISPTKKQMRHYAVQSYEYLFTDQDLM